MLTIYSAGVGQRALDRLGETDRISNSVFTRVFMRNLTTPGLGLRDVAFATQTEVAKLANSVGREQTPGVYSQIIGEDVFLAGKKNAPSADANSDAQMAELENAMKLGTVAALDAFIKNHPDGALANIARMQRQKLAALPAPAQPLAPPTIQQTAPPAKEPEASHESPLQSKPVWRQRRRLRRNRNPLPRRRRSQSPPRSRWRNRAVAAQSATEACRRPYLSRACRRARAAASHFQTGKMLFLQWRALLQLS